MAYTKVVKNPVFKGWYNEIAFNKRVTWLDIKSTKEIIRTTNKLVNDLQK